MISSSYLHVPVFHELKDVPCLARPSILFNNVELAVKSILPFLKRKRRKQMNFRASRMTGKRSRPVTRAGVKCVHQLESEW